MPRYKHRAELVGAKTGLYKVGMYIPKSGKRHQGNEIHGGNSVCACLKTGGGQNAINRGLPSKSPPINAERVF